MPPVAEDADFAAALERLQQRGTGGIRSWRALAKRLHELDSSQTLDDWKSTINRYRRRAANPREERIRLFAQAFGVDRDEFPPAARRQTLAEVREELADVRGRLAALETVVANLEIERRKAEREATLRARRRAS
jgi:transcriptional regulator with XRE-family HTH domain